MPRWQFVQRIGHHGSNKIYNLFFKRMLDSLWLGIGPCSVAHAPKLLCFGWEETTEGDNRDT